MKLKSLPEDFVVEELTDFPCRGGDHAFYRLEKRSLGTPEAVGAIAARWNLSRRQIAYGGLKDRHAHTLQYLTIQRGPARDLEERSFQLSYLGQADRPYGPKEILGNRFQIVLRSIDASNQQSLESKLQRLSEGWINYFDDQRFGSLGFSGQFCAQPWCLGDYQRALWLALADPNPHDRPREKEQKEILRKHWGNWPLCKDQLDRSHRRSIVSYLCDHPEDFRKAIGLLRIDLRGLYLSAFQSWIWNRWASGLIEQAVPSSQREARDSRCGLLWHPIWQSNMESANSRLQWLQQLLLPLPSARQHHWPEGTEATLQQVLQPLGMEVRQLRVKFPRDSFFSKGDRAVWIVPSQLEYRFFRSVSGKPDSPSASPQSPTAPPPKALDPIDPASTTPASTKPSRRVDLQLGFTLSRGCYATMLVKQLDGVAVDLAEDQNTEERSQSD